MQTGSNPTLDANAQHPPEIRGSDPRHLGNLTKKMNAINSQVASDTKYDPAPPPRVDQNGRPVAENFSNFETVPISDVKLVAERLYIATGLAGIVLVVVAVIFADPKLRKQAAQIEHGYLLLGSVALLSIITIGITLNYLKNTELAMWYPQGRGIDFYTQ
jgi:hypothetical protein